MAASSIPILGRSKSVILVVAVCVLALTAVAKKAFDKATALVALRQAQSFLDQRYSVLAADVLDPHREVLAKSADGCRAMFSSYFLSNDIRRLNWASQACLANGLDLPEAYLGLATSFEANGRDTDALDTLYSVLGKSQKSGGASAVRF
jgi:hypothetical protein